MPPRYSPFYHDSEPWDAAELGLDQWEDGFHRDFSTDEPSPNATYEQLQEEVAAPLPQGVGEADKIAATLREVKLVYESTDDAAKQRLKGVWEVAG